MFFRLLGIFLVLLMINPSFGQEPSEKLTERILDLNECVRLCQLNSEKLLRAKKDIEIAKQRLKESSSFIYPRLDLNFNYSRYAADDYFALPTSFGSTLLPPFEPHDIVNSSDYFSTRISLYQDLYNAGRFLATRNMAQAELKRAESQYDQIKNETIFLTKKTFYELLESIEKIKEYKSIEKILKQIVDDASRRNLAGNEQKRIQLEISYLQSRINLAEHQMNQKKLQLLNVTGLELNTTISLRGELKPVIATDVDLNKCLAWAYRFRPELRQIQVQEEMDALSVNLTVAQQRPTIVLGINYVMEGDYFPFPKRDWSATVNMSLPLFEGWAGWSRLRQSELRAEQSRLKRVEYEDKVDYEVREAYEKYVFWKKEVEQRNKIMDDTNKLYEDTKSKWSINETRADVLVDTLKLFVAIVDSYRESVVGLLVSQSELETAMGKVFAEK